MADVTVIDHPLVQHKLSIMRRKDTPTAKFRQLLNEISLLLGYEVTHDLAIEMRTITAVRHPDERAGVPRLGAVGRHAHERRGRVLRHSARSSVAPLPKQTTS